MFQKLIDDHTPAQLAQMAIDAGYPTEDLLDSEDETVREVARKNLESK